MDKEHEEILEEILKSAEHLGCLKCAIWDEAAKGFGKRGMCEKCFNERYDLDSQDLINDGKVIHSDQPENNLNTVIPEKIIKSFDSKLLSVPTSDCVLNLFESLSQIPKSPDQLMRFTRPSREERIRWVTEYVNRLKADLRVALEDLEKIEDEDK